MSVPPRVDAPFVDVTNLKLATVTREYPGRVPGNFVTRLRRIAALRASRDPEFAKLVTILLGPSHEGN